jgi:hypothetical protein
VVAPANPQANITGFRVSPDGRWIAYVSTETGQTEVFVTSISGSGGKWQISTNGGEFPAWRGDGKQLYYDDHADTLFAVDVSEDNGNFVVGQAHRLFQVNAFANGTPYDVTRDGKRFLFNVGTQDASAPLNLVVNWPAEVKK